MIEIEREVPTLVIPSIVHRRRCRTSISISEIQIQDRKGEAAIFLFPFFQNHPIFQIKVMVDVATQTDEDVISCLIM